MKSLKRFKSQKPLLIGLVLLVALVVVSTIFNNEFKSNISDEAKMKDLEIIELAVNKSINDHLPSERKIPNRLTELDIVGLQGMLGEYEYKDYEATYQGGIYTLCTNFKEQGEKRQNDYFTTTGIDAYMIHNKGKTCFENSVYKGSSHIRTL